MQEVGAPVAALQVTVRRRKRIGSDRTEAGEVFDIFAVLLPLSYYKARMRRVALIEA